MFIVAQLFTSLAVLCSMIFKVLYVLLVVRIVLSWFVTDSYNEVVSALIRVTDPILLPFRKLPLQIGGLDLSPIFAFIVLQFLDSFIVGVLRGLAYKFGGGAI